MWLLLLGLLLAAFVLAIMSPEARRAVAYAVALVVSLVIFYVVSDVMRSFREIKRSHDASKLIALSEVTVDDLQLTGSTPATYEIRGLVHNLSPTYTLTLARFTFVVEDCVAPRDCRAQAEGHAEVIREVPPKQAAAFTTRTIIVKGDSGLPPPRGARRLIPKVWLTMALLPRDGRGRD